MCVLLKEGKEVVKYAVSGTAEFNVFPGFKDLGTQTEPIQDKKTNKSHSTQTPKGIGTLVNSVQVKHVRSWGTQTIPMHCFPVHYVCTSKWKHFWGFLYKKKCLYLWYSPLCTLSLIFHFHLISPLFFLHLFGLQYLFVWFILTLSCK